MKRLLLIIAAVLLTTFVSRAQEVEIRMESSGYGLYNIRSSHWTVKPVFKNIKYLGSYTGILYYALQTDNDLWGVVCSQNYSNYRLSPKFAEIEPWYRENFASAPIIFVKKNADWAVMEIYTPKCYYLFGEPRFKAFGANYDNSLFSIAWDGTRRTYPYEDVIRAFRSACEYEKKEKETRARQEADAQARAKKEKELASFTEYARNYVTPIVNEWQKKGEFEKIADYQKRVTGASRLTKIDECTREAEQKFILEHTDLNPIEKMTLGSYDSENEVFPIESEKFGQLLLYVPISEGLSFKENFGSVKKESPQYFIENDAIALRALTFTNPANGKSYTYHNNAALNYSQYEINADDLDIESVRITTSAPTTLSSGSFKPTCEILSPKKGDKYSEDVITLRYHAKVATGKPEVNITVNGADAEIVTAPGNTKGARMVTGTEVMIKAPRKVGEKCVITLWVRDSEGLCSEPKKVELFYVGEQPKPALHLFAVGVGDYQTNDLDDLEYAAKDARDFIDVVSGLNTEMYSGIKSMTLIDRQATTVGIKRELSNLVSNVQQGDVVMVYFSGHGVMEAGETYFISSDASAAEYFNGVDFDFIKKRLKMMVEDKKCRVILFMDTCHSGAMYGAKGAVKDFTMTVPGLVGFYSSAESQQSVESSKRKNGVFTHAVISGLKGAAANKDGEITLNALEEYVKKQVKAETDNRQDSITENPLGDAVLFRVK